MTDLLHKIPDKVWLFLVLAALLGVYAYRPEPVVQRWAEYALIGLIALLRGTGQTLVFGDAAAAKAIASSINASERR